MALINCPECDARISDRAIACPKCGCPATETREVATAAAPSPADGASGQAQPATSSSPAEASQVAQSLASGGNGSAAASAEADQPNPFASKGGSVELAQEIGPALAGPSAGEEEKPTPRGWALTLALIGIAVGIAAAKSNAKAFAPAGVLIAVAIGIWQRGSGFVPQKSASGSSAHMVTWLVITAIGVFAFFGALVAPADGDSVKLTEDYLLGSWKTEAKVTKSEGGTDRTISAEGMVEFDKDGTFSDRSTMTWEFGGMVGKVTISSSGTWKVVEKKVHMTMTDFHVASFDAPPEFPFKKGEFEQMLGEDLGKVDVMTPASLMENSVSLITEDDFVFHYKREGKSPRLGSILGHSPGRVDEIMDWAARTHFLSKKG